MMERESTPAQGSSGGPVPYRVRLELFEGPLDLLLHLIKKNEVEITDIPVATITEQYLACLDFMHELDLDVAGEFLVMAATLLLLKSRMLLPRSPEDENDGDDGPDPRADLVRQLLEYQRYREAAARLRERPLLGRDVFARGGDAGGVLEVDGDGDETPRVQASIWQLLEAFRELLRKRQAVLVHEVESESVSLPDRVRAIVQTLSVARSVEFDSLFDERSSRRVLIVTFLAVLELVRMGVIEAVQEERFGPILLVLAVDDPSGISIELVDAYDGSKTEETAAPDQGGREEVAE